MEYSACVYCGKNNKPTKEHIFPKSLGGDDKRFLLSSEVCGECNNFFSRLELKLARNHFVGLNRWMSTEKAERKESGSFGVKSLDGVSQVFFEGTNVPLEVSNSKKGYLGSQIIIDKDMWYYILPPDITADYFFDKEVDMFNCEKINIIRKIKYGDSSIYLVSVLIWDGYTYIEAESYESPKPPASGLWIESLLEEDAARELSRIIVTGENVFRLRCTPSEDIAEVCRLARRFVINAERETKNFVSGNHKTVLTMPLSIDEPKRALAKIAFNFFIWRVGAKNASIPWFKKIKKYIMQGGDYQSVNYILEENADPISKRFFGKCPPEYHVASLTIEPEGGNRYNVFFSMRLYGKDFFSIVIGIKVPLPFGAPADIAQYYVIDYKNDIVNVYNWRRYDELYEVSAMERIPLDKTYRLAPGVIVGDRKSPLVDSKFYKIPKRKRKIRY